MRLCHVIELAPGRRYGLTELEDIFKPEKSGAAQEAKHTSTFLEFFSKYVHQLRPSARSQAVGLCPFHDDKNPSFSLRTTDGVWHCFGCGRKGNAVSFCMMRSIDLDECPAAAQHQEHIALAVERGGYVTWKKVKDGWHKIKFSNFVLEFDLEKRVTDHIRLEDRLYQGTIVTNAGEKIPLRLSNKEFCSNETFYQVLLREGGSRISVNENYIRHLRRACLLFSKAKQLSTSMDFGFQDDETFLTPTLLITASGITKAQESQIDLTPVEHAKHLDLKTASKKKRGRLLRHIRKSLLELQPHKVTYTVLGFLGAAPLMHFLDDKTRYALWLVGPSGAGKSFLAKLFQCFFGNFMAEGRAASWSSTPNSLQYMGYHFKDCIFLVDDYKPAMVRNESGVVQFLQTYADFYGRSRLTSDIRSRPDYYIRGTLLTTGEDIPSGHSSVVARSLILHVPKGKPDIQKGDRCRKNCKHYPAVVARYVRYLLARKSLRSQVQRELEVFHEMFLKGIEREENSVRIARNLALNWLGFFWFTRFLKATDTGFDIETMRKEHLTNLLRLRDEMLRMIQEEQVAVVFLESLKAGFAAGLCRLLIPGEPRRVGIADVGLHSDHKEPFVYLIPQEAVAFVRSQQNRLGRDFNWTTNAVSKALHQCGALIKIQKGSDYGTRLHRGKKSYRVWMIQKKSLEMDQEHTASAPSSL